MLPSKASIAPCILLFFTDIHSPGFSKFFRNKSIGKTNLMEVVEKDFEKKMCYHIEDGLLFSDEISRLFLPDKMTTGFSVTFTVLGTGVGFGKTGKHRDPYVLEYMENSEEKIIFVENAHELKREEIKTVFAASRRNTSLKFVLEIATPHMPDVKLEQGYYEVVELKEMEKESTIKLLKGICPKFSELIVKRIISLSKGYPYVTRAIAYLCDNKNTEDEMLQFLDILRDNDMKYNLDKINESVLKSLSEDAKKVVKRLAIAPRDLTMKLIKAFCNDTVGDLDTPLSELIARRIIVGEEKGFYRIYHPLFREYLRSKDVQPMALENENEYYRRAMEEVKAEFDSIYILLEVLNEADIFEELIKLTENHEVINSVGVQTLTWGKLEQALCAWNLLLKKTKGVNKKWESIAMGNIGRVHYIRSDLDKALEYYEAALKLHGESGNKEMANQLKNIGNVYRVKGELNKALEYYKRSLNLNEELGIKEGMADALGNIGVVYRKKGELDKALEHLERALKLDDDLERKNGIAVRLGNIGIVYFDKKELGNALEYYEKALKLNEDLGRKRGMANQLENIGDIYRKKGELDKALEYYKKALKNFKDIGTRIETARTLMSIGDVFALKGDEERALNYYLEAQDLAIGSSIFEEISKRIINIRGE